MSRATLIATLIRAPVGPLPPDLSAAAGAVEVRADLAGEVDPAALRDGFDGPLLYTLRSRAEGGGGPDRAEERHGRLAAAAETFDWVDLEAERDLIPACLERIPAQKRIISWHGEADEVEEVRARLHAMSGHPARWYKLVVAAENARQALVPLALLRSTARHDLVAFASGAVGSWTRLLAPRLGAPVIFAAADEPGAPGQIPLDLLIGDYGLPELAPVDRLFGIIGRPVVDSLSPRLHNAVYREQGVAALYLAFEPRTFGDFWLDVAESGSLDELGFELGGLSVTAPFKQVAQAVAGASSPLAERIGSANTLVRSGAVWEAESTDPQGLLEALAAAGVDPRGRAAAVVGAGGAGRAAAFGLAHAGARVSLVNRSVGRGRRAADELEIDFVPFHALDPGDFELLVNATPLGREDDGELPFDPAAAAGAAVVDLAYRRDAATRLVREVRAHGGTAVDGREVLLHQAVPQYRMMIGRPLPLETGRRALGLEPAG